MFTIYTCFSHSYICLYVNNIYFLYILNLYIFYIDLLDSWECPVFWLSKNCWGKKSSQNIKFRPWLASNSSDIVWVPHFQILYHVIYIYVFIIYISNDTYIYINSICMYVFNHTIYIYIWIYTNIHYVIIWW